MGVRMVTNLKDRWLAPIILALAASALGGCATGSSPKTEIAKAEFAIGEADKAGARNEAPLVFRDAEQNLQEAKDLTKKRKYQQAKRKAENAQLDAQYAQSLSASKQWQRAVDALNATQASLKEELDRSVKP